jgi:hypothetical protein
VSWNVSSTIKLRAYEYQEVIEAIRNDKALSEAGSLAPHQLPLHHSSHMKKKLI